MIERLWALELPVVTVAVADLESLLDLPWWMDNDVRFCLSPAAVLAKPGLYPEHHRRIAGADLGFPLHLTRLDNRLTILDGVHRLDRAVRGAGRGRGPARAGFAARLIGRARPRRSCHPS